MFEYVCEVCGKVRHVRCRKDIGRFCSQACHGKSRANKKKGPRYQGGVCVFQPEAVMCEERNCGNCGWNPAVAKARLEVYGGF